MSQTRAYLHQFPRAGQVCWIGVRPQRGAPMVEVQQVTASTADGLQGDFFSGPPQAPRQVTLIQREHLHAVGDLLGGEPVDPARVRRNIVVSGLNLQALKHKTFQIGTALLRGTGNCAPCSQMESALGLGGYNAMRGHGGITAAVVRSGEIRVGDAVEYVPSDSDANEQPEE